jgi:hypothetical protein
MKAEYRIWFHGASFETAAEPVLGPRAARTWGRLLRMRHFLNAIRKAHLMLRSARRARLEARIAAIASDFFTSSFAEVTANALQARVLV